MYFTEQSDLCLKFFKAEKAFETDEENDTNEPTAAETGTKCTEEPRNKSNKPKQAEKDIESNEEPVTEISKNLGTFKNLQEAEDSAQNTNHDSEKGKS